MQFLWAALNQKELTALIIYESWGNCSEFIRQSLLPAESHSFSNKYGIGNCGNGKMKLLATSNNLGKETQRLKKGFCGKTGI